VLLELQAFVLLCGLAAVAFSAEPAAALRGRLLAWWVGFVLASLVLRPFAVPAVSGLEPTQAAMLMVLMVAFSLRSQQPQMSALFSGVLGALWLSALLVAGTPLSLAPVLAIGLPLSGVLMSVRRGCFVTAALRDEARLIVLLAALAMTVVPAVIQGWQLRVSSQALAAEAADGAHWLLALTALALLAGALYRFFRGWK